MIPFVEDTDPKIPFDDDGDPTGVEKEPTGLAKQDRVRRVPFTGVVPNGESHPEEEGGDEEKSERRENRRLLSKVVL